MFSFPLTFSYWVNYSSTTQGVLAEDILSYNDTKEKGWQIRVDHNKPNLQIGWSNIKIISKNDIMFWEFKVILFLLILLLFIFIYLVHTIWKSDD